jgi:hypothetical protein
MLDCAPAHGETTRLAQKFELVEIHDQRCSVISGDHARKVDGTLGHARKRCSVINKNSYSRRSNK